MDALIYTAMSGAERTLREQQVRANNLANADTPGFRADVAFSTALATPGYGYDDRHMSQLNADGVSARSGVLKSTGRELDVAITGEGYFAVQHRGAQEAYTRSGQFTVDADGALNVNGRPVIGDGGPIVLPAFTRVDVAADGTVSIQPPGQEDLQPVDRIKTVRPLGGEVTKNEAGLIVARDGQPLPADNTVTMRSGHLEGSNVSAVEEMVATMTLSRDFEVQMKLFGSAERMSEAGNRLLRG